MNLLRKLGYATLVVFLGLFPVTGATSANAHLNTVLTSASANEPSSERSTVPEPSTAAATLTVTGVTTWLNNNGTLRVEGTIEAHTSVTNPQLTLSISQNSLDSTTQVANWKDDPASHRQIADNAKLETELPESLAQGSSTPFAFNLEPREAGLSTSDPLGSWGARGLLLDLDGVSDYSVTALPATTFTTWFPDPGIKQTSLGSIIPITYTGYSPNGMLSAEQLQELVTTGAFKHGLDTLRANPDSAVALDPRVIVSIEALTGTQALTEPIDNSPAEGADASSGATPVTAPEASPQTPATDSEDSQNSGEVSGPASEQPGTEPEGQSSQENQPTASAELRTWWEEFATEAQKHTIIALPWADADLTALKTSELGQYANQAAEERDYVSTVFPDALTNWAWPAQGQASAATVSGLEQLGYDSVILADSQLPSATGYSVNAPTRLRITGINSESGPTVTSVSAPDAPQGRTSTSGSPGLGALITDTALTQAVENLSRGSESSTASARAEIAALTAAITAERPFDPRTLAVPFPRTTATANWAGANEMLSQLPWINSVNFTDMSSAPAGERGAFVTGDDSKTLAANLGGVGSNAQKLHDFASVFTDPDSARTAAARAVLTCTSIEFGKRAAGTPSGPANQSINDCRTDVDTDAHTITSGLNVEQGSNVLLVTGEDTTIPVTIANATGREVRVAARLRASTPQLKTQDSDYVVIPAGQTSRVSIPVRGLANADVSSTVVLVSTDGYTADSTSNMTISVRADWENIGTAVIGTTLGIVFVVGLVFSVRRGRRKIPKNQLDAALARVKD